MVTTFFLLCNKYCVYLLMKKFDKMLTHFGDALCHFYFLFLFFLSHVVFNLTMECIPRVPNLSKVRNYLNTKFMCFVATFSCAKKIWVFKVFNLNHLTLQNKRIKNKQPIKLTGNFVIIIYAWHNFCIELWETINYTSQNAHGCVGWKSYRIIDFYLVRMHGSFIRFGPISNL